MKKLNKWEGKDKNDFFKDVPNKNRVFLQYFERRYFLFQWFFDIFWGTKYKCIFKIFFEESNTGNFLGRISRPKIFLFKVINLYILFLKNLRIITYIFRLLKDILFKNGRVYLRRSSQPKNWGLFKRYFKGLSDEKEVLKRYLMDLLKEDILPKSPWFVRIFFFNNTWPNLKFV